MTIETAKFAVQRGTTQYGVIGDDIGDKLADGDVLAVSRGGVTKHFTYDGSNIDDIADTDLLACTDTDGVTYSVTGAQFKDLFVKLYQIKEVIDNAMFGQVVLYETDPNAFTTPVPSGSTITQVKPVQKNTTNVDDLYYRNGYWMFEVDYFGISQFDADGYLSYDTP